ANTEGAWTLLRKAFILYGEHFPTFIRISLIGYIPTIVLGFMAIVLQFFLPRDPKSITTLSLAMIILYFFIALLSIFSFVAKFFANAVNVVVFVPVLAQLLVVPLRPVEIRPAFAALKKRLSPFVTTALLFYLAVSPILLLIAIPVIAGIWLKIHQMWILLTLLPILLLSIVGLRNYIN